METKEFKIQVPDGYEIDKKNSTFDCVKFKPIDKKLTYEDVVKDLFSECYTYCLDYKSNVIERFRGVSYKDLSNGLNCTSKKQAEKLIAINKLMNVAKYLNGKAKTMPKDGRLYYLLLDDGNIKSDWIIPSAINYGCVFFYSRELSQIAVDILGEDTIRTALSIDW